jgi:hypothetical protein
MSLAPAPAPKPGPPIEPCLESFHAVEKGINPLDTADPIMAVMGLYFKERAVRERTENGPPF